MKAGRRAIALIVAAVLAFGVAPAASAAPVSLDYQPFGNATAGPGGVTLSSTNAAWPDPTSFAGVNFSLPSGSVTYGEILSLSTEFEVLAGNCGGGAPRFELETAAGSIFVYMGTAPNFTDCGATMGDTGNLLGTSDLRCDTSQIGGAFYDSCANIPTNTVITGIALVVDGGWSQTGGLQSFLMNPSVVIDVEATEVTDLCVSWFGIARAIEDGQDCARYEESVSTFDDPVFCFNRLSGLVRVVEDESDCTRYETSHMLSTDGGFWACRNPFSSILRATESFDTCAYYEEAVYVAVPAV